MDTETKEILAEMQEQIYKLGSELYSLMITHNRLNMKMIGFHEDPDDVPRMHGMIELKIEDTIGALHKWGERCEANLRRLDPDLLSNTSQ